MRTFEYALLTIFALLMAMLIVNAAVRPIVQAMNDSANLIAETRRQ